MEIIDFIHIITLLITAFFIVKSDHYGYQWFRGQIAVLDARKITHLHTAVTVGLTGMFVTGFILFLPARDYYVMQSGFFIKMSFILALVVNSFFIHHLMHIALTKPFSQTTTRERVFLFVSGGVSTVSWFGATFTAFFLL